MRMNEKMHGRKRVKVRKPISVESTVSINCLQENERDFILMNGRGICRIICEKNCHETEFKLGETDGETNTI